MLDSDRSAPDRAESFTLLLDADRYFWWCSGREIPFDPHALRSFALERWPVNRFLAFSLELAIPRHAALAFELNGYTLIRCALGSDPAGVDDAPPAAITAWAQEHCLGHPGTRGVIIATDPRRLPTIRALAGAFRQTGQHLICLTIGGDHGVPPNITAVASEPEAAQAAGAEQGDEIAVGMVEVVRAIEHHTPSRTTVFDHPPPGVRAALSAAVRLAHALGKEARPLSRVIELTAEALPPEVPARAVHQFIAALSDVRYLKPVAVRGLKSEQYFVHFAAWKQHPFLAAASAALGIAAPAARPPEKPRTTKRTAAVVAPSDAPPLALARSCVPRSPSQASATLGSDVARTTRDPQDLAVVDAAWVWAVGQRSTDTREEVGLAACRAHSTFGNIDRALAIALETPGTEGISACCAIARLDPQRAPQAVERARTIARAFTENVTIAKAFDRIARVSRAREDADAVRAACERSQPLTTGEGSWAARYLVDALLSTDDIPGARDLARSILLPEARIDAWSEIAHTTGLPEDLAALLREIEMNGVKRFAAARFLIAICAEQGRADAATRIATTGWGPAERLALLALVAAATGLLEPLLAAEREYVTLVRSGAGSGDALGLARFFLTRALSARGLRTEALGMAGGVTELRLRCRSFLAVHAADAGFTTPEQLPSFLRGASVELA
jgi:hypothetical protein